MLIEQTFPDPEYDDEDDNNQAGLDLESVNDTNKIELDVSKSATQAITEEGEASTSQSHTEGGLLESPLSKTQQPRTSSDGGETINPEIATTSGIAVDSHQVDRSPTRSQTDASASLSHAPASCQNTKQPPGSRQTNLVPDHAVVRLIERADRSAGRLVNLLATHFPCSFRDEARFDGRKVKLYKRAQIFVADLWAALNARRLGEFDDIDHLTMFPGASMSAPQRLCAWAADQASPRMEAAAVQLMCLPCRLSRCADVAGTGRALLQSSS